MEWALTAAGLAVLGFSARYTWWRPRKKGVPVLMYHFISDDIKGTSLAKLRVGPAAFARQLDFLRARGYRAVTLSQALAGRPREKQVVITFDDGYSDFYFTAWPLLAERGMTATVFMVTSGLDNINRWDLDKGEPKAAMLSRVQVRELAEQGVEFGGHSHTHQDLTKLDERALRREVTGCQKILSDLLGRPSRVFSYPYGLASVVAAQAVERAGFLAACTTRPGMLSINAPRMDLPRIIVKRGDDMLDFRLKLNRGRSRL